MNKTFHYLPIYQVIHTNLLNILFSGWSIFLCRGTSLHWFVTEETIIWQNAVCKGIPASVKQKKLNNGDEAPRWIITQRNPRSRTHARTHARTQTNKQTRTTLTPAVKGLLSKQILFSSTFHPRKRNRFKNVTYTGSARNNCTTNLDAREPVIWCLNKKQFGRLFTKIIHPYAC